MLRLDMLRKTLDTEMLSAVGEAFLEQHMDWQWRGINTPLVMDKSKVLVISGFLPNKAESQELGGPGALSIRHGVYVVTFSIPEKTSVDNIWLAAARLEGWFRRRRLDTEAGAFWCDEPYTENNGTEPSEGRFLISTTIPWTAVSC